MNKLNVSNATPDDLYEWCMKEYNSQNPISKILIKCFYNKLGKAIDPIKPNISKILEIGCGGGESSIRLMKLFGDIKYDATEYDPRYIEVIKKRKLPINISNEDVYNIKRPDCSYDCVIMLEVLEHLEYIEKALTELFRVSNKYIIISVPNEPIWSFGNFLRGKYLLHLGNTPGHINHFNKKKLLKYLNPYVTNIKFYFSFPWIILIAEKK